MILIATGRLALLPLHAAVFELAAISYVPSARALQAAVNAAKERAVLSPVLLGIGNPLPNPQPLAFARIEVEEIAPFFTADARRVLFEHQATRAATLRALPGATHLHFSCHGAFNVEEPLDSALSLAGQDQLTLRNLLDNGLALSTARLAILSACQTGIIDFRHVPDEAVGFSAGFLQAAVPGVITTLWPVADISTAILLVRFYHHHLVESLDPATALQQSQQWLRNATAQQMALAEYWERCYQASGRHDAYAWRAMRYHRAHPDERPFAHPYYWATFTFSGA